MKIGFYSPYFDSFGGGERYVLSLAEHWSETHAVDIFWNDASIISEVKKRLNLELGHCRVVPNVFAGKNIFNKAFVTSHYDVFFFLSDGSVPTTFAKHNILHFQVPFAHVPVSRLKMSRFDRVVCNSEFTKEYLDQTVMAFRNVIYPPVDIKPVSGLKKKRTILSVGRFSKAYDVKKFDILIDAFRRAHKMTQFSNWRLVLAGGVLPHDQDYFQYLKLRAKGLPIEFYPNCSFLTLMKLYAEASIYWHAAGYGETKPEHMEHFGITTVEAMVAGCIPVVFAGGGQTEIVSNGKNGFLWKTPTELIEKTAILIHKMDSLSPLRLAAKKRSGDFSKERFCQSFDMLLEDITEKRSI